MNTDEIKWIPFYKYSSDSLSRSFYEKLKRFGFCLCLDEYGSDKASKAQLAVLDAVCGSEKPNVLIICPHHFMHSWYRAIVTGAGADFKMISGSAHAITYFDKNASNLFIMSENALRPDFPLLGEIAESGIVWNLIIIDGGISTSGIDCKLYLDAIKNRTNALAVFSPVPFGYNEGFDGIRSLVKGLLADNEKAAVADSIVFDENIVKFDPDVPVSRSYSENVYNGDTARRVVLLEYSFPDELISGSRRIVDVKTGLPLYCFGGNIFEEYSLDAKKIYTKPSYTAADAAALREADKKLDSFLNYLDKALSGEDNKVIVYCMTGSTVSYLAKIINALYAGSPDFLRIDRGVTFNTDYNNFSLDLPDKARVVLAVDSISSVNPVMKRFTHIVNYELPDSPVVLEQRAARHSTAANNIEFAVFRDDKCLFDGRMLSKVLYGKLYRSLIHGLPGRNVLFDIDGAEKMIADCIADLQYVCGYTSEVASSQDVIVKFIGDYNIPSDLKLTTADKTSEYTRLKLEKMYSALGITADIKDNKTDKKTLVELIKPALDSFKSSLLYLDDNWRIVPINGEKLKACQYGEKYEEYEKASAESELSRGVKAAKAALSQYLSDNNRQLLRDAVADMPQTMRMPVLLNTWRYLSEEYIIQKTYKEFMKNYNEGVM